MSKYGFIKFFILIYSWLFFLSASTATTTAATTTGGNIKKLSKLLKMSKIICTFAHGSAQ